MPVQLGVNNGAELRKVALLLRKADKVDLSREVRAGIRKAARPLEREVKASAAAMLPARGGYAAVMARSVKVTLRAGLREGTLTARIYARGKQELRDVVAVNAGRLRHPVFGNRRNWALTRVPAGFVDKPIDRLADRTLDEVAEAAERVLTSIARK